MAHYIFFGGFHFLSHGSVSLFFCFLGGSVAARCYFHRSYPLVVEAWENETKNKTTVAAREKGEDVVWALGIQQTKVESSQGYKARKEVDRHTCHILVAAIQAAHCLDRGRDLSAGSLSNQRSSYFPGGPKPNHTHTPTC